MISRSRIFNRFSSVWVSKDVTIDLICITLDLIDKSKVNLICIIDRRRGLICIIDRRRGLMCINSASKKRPIGVQGRPSLHRVETKAEVCGKMRGNVQECAN